jgi:hypothetical protein
MGSFLSKSTAAAQEQPPLYGDDADESLYIAEHIDGYRAACAASYLNGKSRQYHNYRPSPTPPPSSIQIPSNAIKYSQIIWMDPTADGGLPHTRPPYYICLPSNIDPKTIERTIKHEEIHLMQRLDADFWDAALRSAWDFIRLDAPPKLPDDIQKRVRINPDTFGAPVYAWANEWVAYALFDSQSAPSLHKTVVAWWHIPSSNLFYTPPPDWIDFFGKTLPLAAHEHPYEISAYLLSSDIKSPAKDALENYMKTHV